MLNSINKKILVVFSILFLTVVAQTASAESIKKYDVNIDINSDSSLQVKEDILYDFGTPTEDRHGIYRDIPLEFNVDRNSKKKYLLKIDNVAVVDKNGKPYRVHLKKTRDNLHIKVGDPQQTVTGQHEYLITYQVQNAMYYAPGQNDEKIAELTWRAIGTGWKVPIEKATVTVKTAPDIEADFLQSYCYQGDNTARTPCASNHKEGKQVTFYHRNLAPFAGLTVSVGLPSTAITMADSISVHTMNPWLVFLFMFFAGVGNIFWVWWARGREVAGTGVIIPQYEPLLDTTPAEAHRIVYERLLVVQTFTAEVINLAYLGYLKIINFQVGKKDHYILAQTNSDTSALQPHQVHLMYTFFNSEHTLSRVKLAEFLDPKNGTIFGLGVNNKIKNNPWLANPAEYLQSITSSDTFFSFKYVERFKDNYLANQMTMFVSTVNKQVIQLGWEIPNKTRYNFTSILLMGGPVSVLLLLMKLFFIPSLSPWLIGIPLLGSVIIYVIFYRQFNRRLPEGMRAAEYFLGLKEYLSVAESDRFDFFYAPENNPEQFEKLLAWAIALGVEKKWAKKFANYIHNAPSWYHSTMPVVFNPESFTSDIGTNFISNINTATATSRESSSSGGGSVGVGGGGGGGGSW